MARIGLTQGSYSILPEGEYVFLIKDVEYDETFGEIKIHLVTEDGRTMDERYRLKNGDDTPNEKALNAFSFFAKTALDNFGLDEIDHTDLIGHYIRATVKHTTSPSKKDPTKTVTFANLAEKFPAKGFANAAPEPVQDEAVDEDDTLAALAKLLGM